MPRIAISFHETLAETSAQWCERNSIPPGAYVTLIRKSDGRQIRNNFVIHRRVLPKRADSTDTLKSALDDLKASLITDIDRRRWEIKLRRPNRTDIGGGTHMGTLRQTDPMDGEAEDRASEHEDEIERSRGEIKAMIGNLEYGECISESAIIRGAFKALIEEYGRDVLRRAAEAENIL